MKNNNTETQNSPLGPYVITRFVFKLAKLFEPHSNFNTKLPKIKTGVVFVGIDLLPDSTASLPSVIRHATLGTLRPDCQSTVSRCSRLTTQCCESV